MKIITKTFNELYSVLTSSVAFFYAIWVNFKFLVKVRGYIEPYCSGFKVFYREGKGLTIAFIMDAHESHFNLGTTHNHVIFGFTIHPKLGTQLYLGSDLVQTLNGRIHRLESRSKAFSLGFVDGTDYVPLWIFNASVIGNALHDFLLVGGRVINEESIRMRDINYEVHDTIYAQFFHNALVMDL